MGVHKLRIGLQLSAVNRILRVPAYQLCLLFVITRELRISLAVISLAYNSIKNNSV